MNKDKACKALLRAWHTVSVNSVLLTIIVTTLLGTKNTILGSQRPTTQEFLMLSINFTCLGKSPEAPWALDVLFVNEKL